LAEIAFDNTYSRLPNAFFARVTPAPVPSPALIKINESLASVLDLDADWLSSPAGVAMLAGNAVPTSADPIAMAYAGHQFGGFTPQLGDGRAILLGEVVGRDGIRRDIQLKGSGQTPFSRSGDGKSPLGPVIRDYQVSEAMAALDIPTTRALAAVTTGELVQREDALPGGVLTRVAESHVRVGTFEFFAARGETQLLRNLADYVIDRHYPEARQSENPALAFLKAVIERQASLVSQWMQVGFVHGVMNTDNTQIAGETIDFGPCAFMEHFDARMVFSSIDHRGRYAWRNQPSIAHWNLARLAETLLPLLANDNDLAVTAAEEALAAFDPAFNGHFVDGLHRKLGFSPNHAPDPQRAEAFVNESFDVMTQQSVDFTLFFRHLTLVAAGADTEHFLSLFTDRSAGAQWLESWHAAGPKSLESMRRVNPIFIPRNHRVEEAIQGALRGDYAAFERLNAVLARPFEEQPEHAELERPAEPGERVERTFCGT